MIFIKLNNLNLYKDYSEILHNSYEYITKFQNTTLSIKYTEDSNAINILTDYSHKGKCQEVIFINQSDTILHIKDLMIHKYEKEKIPYREDYIMKFFFQFTFSKEINKNNILFQKFIRLSKIDKLLKESI